MMIEEIIQEKLREVFQDENLIFDKSRFAGGLTNYNYIMNIDGNEYVIRQPGGMTNYMIDREVEKVNSTIATDLGLNSECIYFDEVTGIKISKYIPNSTNIAAANPCDTANLSAVSSLMKKTHASPVVFSNIFDFQTELSKYEDIVEEMNGDFFFDYESLKEKLFDCMKVNLRNLVRIPCHNDTVPENFIVDGEGRMYLIDWEYAGLNDPSWDIAAYILESRLTEDAIEYLFLDYYGQFPTEEELLKIKCFMLAQDLLWTVWALIRHYNGDDFLDYCHIRYERFRKNMREIMASVDYAIADMVKS